MQRRVGAHAALPPAAPQPAHSCSRQWLASLLVCESCHSAAAAAPTWTQPATAARRSCSLQGTQASEPGSTPYRYRSSNAVSVAFHTSGGRSCGPDSCAGHSRRWVLGGHP